MGDFEDEETLVSQEHRGDDSIDSMFVWYPDADFAGSLGDLKSTNKGHLVFVGRNCVVPLVWLCNTLDSVSHSSPEANFGGCGGVRGWVRGGVSGVVRGGEGGWTG